MKTKSKTNLKQKEGISLIVLVITIIVMIVLAAAVIISLSNNGIIDKANEAVEKTDEKQMQILAQTLWVDAYADDKRDNELVTAVQNGLKAVDANYKEKYIVDISNTKVELYKKEWEVIYTGDAYTQEGALLVSEDKDIFDRDSKYRITVESDYYTGIFETEYIIEMNEFYCFAILQEGNTIKYLTPEEFYGFTTGDEEYNIEGIMVGGANLGTMSMIAFQGTEDTINCDYKVKKIEKLKNYKIDDLDKVNEYGFLYNTWYRHTLDLIWEEVYMNVYFCPNNQVYFRIDSLEQDIKNGTTIGIWQIDEDGNLKAFMDRSENSSISIVYTVTGADFLICTAGDRDAVNVGKDFKISKGTTGAYNLGIYKAKDLTIYKDLVTSKYNYTFAENTNVSSGIISITSDGNYISSSFITTDGYVSLEHSNEEFSSDRYTVSADGKTITEKEGDIEVEYVLVEDIYELE